jgi:hypothetical protein
MAQIITFDFEPCYASKYTMSIPVCEALGVDDVDARMRQMSIRSQSDDIMGSPC